MHDQTPDMSGRLVQHLKYGTVWQIDHPFVVVDVVSDGIWVMLAKKHEREAALAEFKRRRIECRRGRSSRFHSREHPHER